MLATVVPHYHLVGYCGYYSPTLSFSLFWLLVVLNPGNLQSLRKFWYNWCYINISQIKMSWRLTVSMSYNRHIQQSSLVGVDRVLFQEEEVVTQQGTLWPSSVVTTSSRRRRRPSVCWPVTLQETGGGTGWARGTVALVTAHHWSSSTPLLLLLHWARSAFGPHLRSFRYQTVNCCQVFIEKNWSSDIIPFLRIKETFSISHRRKVLSILLVP